jgi:hypothetical protein
MSNAVGQSVPGTHEPISRYMDRSALMHWAHKRGMEGLPLYARYYIINSAPVGPETSTLLLNGDVLPSRALSAATRSKPQVSEIRSSKSPSISILLVSQCHEASAQSLSGP